MKKDSRVNGNWTPTRSPSLCDEEVDVYNRPPIFVGSGGPHMYMNLNDRSVYRPHASISLSEFQCALYRVNSKF